MAAVSPPAEPLVSVVLPTYNRELTVARAIDSVLRQTYDNFELIVVDDGSSDATVDIVRSYTDPRIKLIVMAENGGASVARNKGIDEAQGDFIAFQDSDDEWLPEKLQVQMEAAASSPGDDFFFCTLVRLVTTECRANLMPDMVVPSSHEGIQQALLLRNFAWTQTWLARRAVFDSGIRFDQRILRVQDWDLVLQASKKFRLKHVDKVLVIAYETANSLLTLQQQHADDVLVMLDKHRSLYKEASSALATQRRAVCYRAALAGNTPAFRENARLACRANPKKARNWMVLLASLAGSRLVRLLLSLRG